MKLLRVQFQLGCIDFFRHLLTKGWIAASETDVKVVNYIDYLLNTLTNDGGEVGTEENYRQAFHHLSSC